MTQARLYCGDALTVLKTLPEHSARCCVTSPPYWGLRDYGTARWEGGDPDCDHRRGRMVAHDPRSTVAGTTTAQNHSQEPSLGVNGNCSRCGAVRVDAQLGLERTPEEYVEKMVAVFREVRRVLTTDGTLWLNIGDSYTTGGSNRNGLSGDPEERRKEGWGGDDSKRAVKNTKALTGGLKTGVKPKDLVGIPWALAFALRADGWWLRSDIIWAKPNPMPESVTDRPTKAHEHLFLLAKSAKYYYDAAAIAEPFAESSIGRLNQPTFDSQTGGPKDPKCGNRSQRKALENLRRKGKVLTSPRRDGNAWNQGNGHGFVLAGEKRNARSVWDIGTQAYPGAHFATFPEELARRCIVAGSAPGDVVLDPFGGSGTVAQVATGNGRGAVYIDLNPKYVELARQRIGPFLCEVA